MQLLFGDVAISVVQFGITGEWHYAVGDKGSGIPDDDTYFIKKDKFQYPLIQISPELIFANQIQLLDANFIDTSSRTYVIQSTNGTGIQALKDAIANWYATLRWISIVGLLSVLLYVGIRIIISSASQDRAKYKQRIMDWIIAFCILMFMHYIMAAGVTIVNRVNTILAGISGINSSTDLEGINFADKHGGVQYNGDAEASYGGGPFHGSSREDASAYMENLLSSLGINVNGTTPQSGSQGGGVGSVQNGWEVTGVNGYNVDYKREYYTDGGTYTVYAHSNPGNNPGTPGVTTYEYIGPNGENLNTGAATGGTGATGSAGYNLNGLLVSGNSRQVLFFINYARMFLNVNGEEENQAEATGYLIVYWILIAFTIMFAFRYMKRVIYIAFLTMIAPLVAMTYPLDKIRDGKAQAFNMWFKEYLLNLLIQPFHLLLYTILVGLSMELISTSLIYGVVAIAFLLPAEKLLRSFFGLDKGQTLSAAGSFAGGAAFSAILNKINRPKPGAGSHGGNEDKEKARPIRKSNSGGGGVDSERTLIGSSLSGYRTQTVQRFRRTAQEEVQCQYLEDGPGGGSMPTPGGRPRRRYDANTRRTAQEEARCQHPEDGPGGGSMPAPGGRSRK